jgi:hypothetical protein
VRTAVRAGAVAYAVADVAVLVAPSVVLALEARKGGISGFHGLDLVVVSGVVGVVHAIVVVRRLLGEVRTAVRPLDVWIAATDSLVVLAIAVNVLLIAVLGGFAEQHAVLVNRGWWVVWLWVGVQGAAVAVAEGTGRVVFAWLERDRRASRDRIVTTRSPAEGRSGR